MRETSYYKQLIIARRDLQMSPGKLAAQVSHGSTAWLTALIKKDCAKMPSNIGQALGGEFYGAVIWIPADIYEGWIEGSFTKIVCEARNRNQLLKATTIAEELGLHEGEDYFLIKDNCYTELTPEEVDENGVGRTLTVVGFRPLQADVCDKISKKYQLYR